MEPSPLSNVFAMADGELRITLIVCAVSLIAVWVPLMQGAVLCWRARAATSIAKSGSNAASGQVLTLIRQVLRSSVKQSEGDASLPFVRDAAKQLVVDDYETSFAQPISMYANILPPIGFIGTTSGLAVLLLSMRISHDMLQMGALALALSSTIFALVGYAILESLKIHLYARLARSIDAGMGSAD